MNFHDLYSRIDARLSDTIKSLWATGDAQLQKSLDLLFKKEGEKLMAEPVFQSAFPWEPYDKKFGSLDVFDISFIDALNKIKNENFRFPKDRYPYKHQVTSWKALLGLKGTPPKSIAVTTGTGSGKTECFMLPVLHDIYKNSRYTSGINAIFLYPLNALIGSQKERMENWCKALGGIKYAVYNGNTPDQARAANDNDEVVIKSRRRIRNTPPNILFTNPSMLEYILVRDKDVPILKKSQGTLRWILLDEAHTLTGTKATEMALLIRRVVDAFGVKIENMRFAITSATVGNDENSDLALKQFMADLCGINSNQIEVITGSRILPQKLNSLVSKLVNRENIETLLSNQTQWEQYQEVHELRKHLLKNDFITLSNLRTWLPKINISQAIHLIDKLSEYIINDTSILPVRAHYFVRGIGGVFACTNQNCSHNDHQSPYGTLSTHAAATCKCGWPMVELVTCQSCGNNLYESEIETDRKTGDDKISMISRAADDPFSIDVVEDEDAENSTELAEKRIIYFAKRRIGTEGAVNFDLSQDGTMKTSGSMYYYLPEEDPTCVHCKSKLNNPFHFRLSSSFINRTLSDILLEEMPKDTNQTGSMLWEGRKYITFTDSRQGTAKISALLNQDVERGWIRSMVYHYLCKQQSEINQRNINIEDLQLELREIEEELNNNNNIGPRAKLYMMERKTQISNEINNFADAPRASMTWKELEDKIMQYYHAEIKTLYKSTNKQDNYDQELPIYLKTLMLDEFARRLPRERSLENLGMISLQFPGLDNAVLPQIAQQLGITKEEWKSLLKIAIDFNIRYPFHYFYNSGEHKKYTTSNHKSIDLYSATTQLNDVKKWPRLAERVHNPSRLVALICAGLGIDYQNIEHEQIDQVNDLLSKLWSSIKDILTNNGQDGYKLRHFDQVSFTIPNHLWLCPVRRRLIDVHFKGYSPWITARVGNPEQFKIADKIEMPDFEFPFHLNANNEIDLERTREWIHNHSKPLREKGIWNDIHEQVILKRPLYLSGEHSAQQKTSRLEELEDNFKKGYLNILNCSTTMEMGVDISGVAAVIMNNVPPAPANYRQRAGRAGRRGEAKSLALTICAPNPIGTNVMRNPSWALEYKIAPPSLSFNSSIVVYRHVSALFFGKFVQSDAVGGIGIKSNTHDFFVDRSKSLAIKFLNWMDNQRNSEILNNSIKHLIHNTPIHDKTFNYLILHTRDEFYKLMTKFTERYEAMEKRKNQLIEEQSEGSLAVRALAFQIKRYLEKNAISYMIEEGFLPGAGLPTGIVEFDTTSIQDLSRTRVNNQNYKSELRDRSDKEKGSKPSYNASQGLSEFAPGKEVVMDGKVYTSRGIVLRSERDNQAVFRSIQHCKACENDRIVEGDVNSPCNCGGTSFKGVTQENRGSFTQVIEPVGYAVALYETPGRKISAVNKTSYNQPLLLNLQAWDQNNSHLLDCRVMEEDGEILYYNAGSGSGYYVCTHCGRASDKEDDLINHYRLRGGRDEDGVGHCSGNDDLNAIKKNVILGASMRTDFCELRFKDVNGNQLNDKALLYTLGSVLSKNLCHYLGVEESEISFGIKKSNTGSTVFIYDTAKGGAGYSIQFPQYANEVLTEAKKVLKECSCQKACTKCLIDRYTQWHINDLDRHVAIDWLETALNTEATKELKQEYGEITPILGSTGNELTRMALAKNISEIWLFADNHLDQWDPEKLQLLKDLRTQSINIIINNGKQEWTTDEKVQLIQLQAKHKVYTTATKESGTLQTICIVRTQDNRYTQYLAVAPSLSINGDWGNNATGRSYKVSCQQPTGFKELIISLDEQKTINFTIDDQCDSEIESNQLVSLLLNKLENRLDLDAKMRNQNFEVTYSDRYLQSPIGCLMLVQLLDGLQKRFGFGVNSFMFKSKGIAYDPYNKNFKTDSERTECILRWFQELNLPGPQVELSSNTAHFRYLKFVSNYMTVTIRPDGGVEHGWYLKNPKDSEGIRAAHASHPFKLIRKQKEILYSISVERSGS